MKNKTMKFIMSFFIVLMLITFLFYGCGKEKTPPPKAVKTPVTKQIKKGLEVSQPEEESQVTLKREGYVYKRRDRRDPFRPLIVPAKKQKKDDSKIGTLEGYDLSEFVLSAIAKKGTHYFALLVTPDNRSFTVKKGDVIGMNNGKVKEITSDKIRLLEYIEDYKGESRPRHIILEFHKGE